jgi:hypothetical protein
MKLVALATSAAVALVLAAGAGAAMPTKGTEYVGVIKSSPFEMKVLLGVSKSGTKARFTYLCGTGRAPTVVFGVPIDATGRFKWTKATGTVVVWKMAGRFVSPTEAVVSLNSVACGGSKGSAHLTPKQ